ncbi:MAG: hypothetical protein Q9225_001937, partial [Loekoesia sp. 1 TL-2023]
MAKQGPACHNPRLISPPENRQQLMATPASAVVPRPQRDVDPDNATLGNGGGDHVDLMPAPRLNHLDGEDRARLLPQKTDATYKSQRTISPDLCAQGDLGLQSGPRLLEDLYSLNEAHRQPSCEESEYSPNEQLGLICVPKGNRVQYLQSIPSGKSAAPANTPTESFGQNNRYVEITPNHHENKVSAILDSVAPRSRCRRLCQPIRQPSPTSRGRSVDIPQQDSEVTLCGNVASNGEYKVQESNFEKDCTFIKGVGEGGFGRIELYKHNTSSNLLVLKKTRMALEYTNGIPTEAHILRDIIGKAHERLPRLYHFYTSLAEIHYWMDYCDGGDLANLSHYFLHKNRLIPEGFIWHVHTQLSAATAYLHKGLLDRTHPEYPPPPNWQPIVHRDIKPDNIFLKLVPGNQYPDIVLGDFGLATTNLFTGEAGKVLGTPCWQPPQIPFHTIYSDVWAAGAVIHQLALVYPPLSGQPPYDSRPAVEWECDGRVRRVWDVGTNG